MLILNKYKYSGLFIHYRSLTAELKWHINKYMYLKQFLKIQVTTKRHNNPSIYCSFVGCMYSFFNLYHVPFLQITLLISSGLVFLYVYLVNSFI